MSNRLDPDQGAKELNAQANISSGAIGLKFGRSFPLIPYFVVRKPKSLLRLQVCQARLSLLCFTMPEVPKVCVLVHIKYPPTEEHSGSVVECLTRDRGIAVGASLEALHCVFEQDTLSSA